MHKRGVLTIVAFLILVVTVDRMLAALLDAGFRRIEIGQTGGMVNRALRSEADVIVLGSSRAWRHYDTTVLGDALGRSVYNAGCDGQGIPYMRGLVDLVLKRHTPELFIINIDANMLAERDRHLGRIPVLAPFMDESEVVREMIYRRAPFERLKYLSRSYRYNGKVAAILANHGRRDPSVNGYLPIEGCMDPTAPVDNEPASELAALPEADPYFVELLRAMIRQAHDAGARVVLVTGPRWFGDGRIDPGRRHLISVVDAIASEEGVPYFKLTIEQEPVFQDPALYVNTSHLNRQGAALFSEMLGARLGDWLETGAAGP